MSASDSAPLFAPAPAPSLARPAPLGVEIVGAALLFFACAVIDQKQTASDSLRWAIMAMLAVVLGAFGSARLLRERQIKITLLDLGVILGFTWVGLSSFWAIDIGASIMGIVKAWIYLALYFLARGRLFPTRPAPLMLACTGAVLLIVGWAEWRPNSFGGYANENFMTETVLALLVPMTVGALQQHSKEERWLGDTHYLILMLAILCVVYLIVWNGSKIEFAILPAVALAALWRFASWKVALPLSVLAMILLAVLLQWPPASERLLAERSILERITLFTNSWNAMLERPWFGWGLGSFNHAYALHQEDYIAAWPHLTLPPVVKGNMLAGAAHNEYLQTVAEFGLVGALILGLLIVSVVVAYLRAPRKSTLGDIGYFLWAVLAANSLIEFPLQKPATGCLAALGLGLMAADARTRSFALPATGLPVALLGLARLALTILSCALFLADWRSLRTYETLLLVYTTEPREAFRANLDAFAQFEMNPEHRTRLYNSAVNWLLRARDLDPGDEEGRRWRDPAFLDELFAITSAANPGYPETKISRMKELMLNGRLLAPGGAETFHGLAAAIVRITPNDADFWLTWGTGLQALGDQAGALAKLKRARALADSLYIAETADRLMDELEAPATPSEQAPAAPSGEAPSGEAPSGEATTDETAQPASSPSPMPPPP